ncbi:ELM1/GtrOC1 family putative glycosyltransferase [Campylobacter sputorum]|uniref:ELM1/GtrOC1 family putative glycosyltransferase n=1 Tax=Campylobacter sputorum TaxID=206 RepID=UPI001F382F85|nr:ELM1/GtrOC1 family putative glycosyltransferase [Campylobacter sputorum]ASM36780.1 ELM1 domain protein [Campylobacter sputorum bv. faecalis CCUG 20703]
MKALIISDKRVGHESQSVAFCRLLGFEFEITSIKFKNKFLKILSYILDFLRIYKNIFECELKSGYDLVVSAGSTTYYANKYYAKKNGIKNIALMMPKGFRKDFSYIFATKNDVKKELLNLVVLPVNLNFLEKKEFYTPQKKAISFIIGGENKIYKILPDILNKIDEIMSKFSDYECMITTSPRTPKWLENELKKRNFSFTVWFSENKINPIYDFTHKSEFVFITQDSVSMISEAVCNGSANVCILELCKNKTSKFDEFLLNLKELNLVQIYDSNARLKQTKKFNLKKVLESINLC